MGVGKLLNQKKWSSWPKQKKKKKKKKIDSGLSKA
jgi:hypothetical protein